MTMSFRAYWNWKHTVLVLFVFGNALITNAAAPIAELAATVVLTPLVLVALIYAYWSMRVKTSDPTSA